MVEISPISSRTSSPDSQKRSSRQDSVSSNVSAGSGISTPQTAFLQKTKQLREQQASAIESTPVNPQSHIQSSPVYSAEKPPIPPRGLPPPVPQRQTPVNEGVQLRNRSGKYKKTLIKKRKKIKRTNFISRSSLWKCAK